MPDDTPIGPTPVPTENQNTVLHETGGMRTAMIIDHEIIHSKAGGDAVYITDCFIDESTNDPYRVPTPTELADVNAASTTSLMKASSIDANMTWIEYVLHCVTCAMAVITANASLASPHVPVICSHADAATNDRMLITTFSAAVKQVLLDEHIRAWVNAQPVSTGFYEIFDHLNWSSLPAMGLWNPAGAHHWKRMMREMIIAAAKESRFDQWGDYTSQEDQVIDRFTYDIICKTIRIVADKEFAPLLQTGSAFWQLATYEPKKIPPNKVDINQFKNSFHDVWKYWAKDDQLREVMPVEFLDGQNVTYSQLLGDNIIDTLIKGTTLDHFLSSFAHTFTTHQEVIDETRCRYGVCTYKFLNDTIHVLIGKTMCSRSRNDTTNATSNLKVGGVNSVQGYGGKWILGIDEVIAFKYFRSTSNWNDAWKKQFSRRKHRSFAVIPESFKTQFSVGMQMFKTFNGYCDPEAPLPYFYDVNFNGNLSGESVAYPAPEADYPLFAHRCQHDALALLDINVMHYLIVNLRKDAPKDYKITFHHKQSCTPEALKHRAIFWKNNMRKTSKVGSADFERNWFTRSHYVELVDSVTKNLVCMMGVNNDVIRYENIKAPYYSGFYSVWHKLGHQISHKEPVIATGNIIVQAARTQLKGKESISYSRLAEKERKLSDWIISMFTFGGSKGVVIASDPIINSKVESVAAKVEEQKSNEDDDEVKV